MRTLTLRKAYKISCELKERVASAINAISVSTKYDIYDAMGKLEDVIESLHKTQLVNLAANMQATELVCSIRQRIQEANNKPLPYADGATINDLIAKQAMLKTMVAFFPEDSRVTVTASTDLAIQAERNRAVLDDKTNPYRSSTNVNLSITGTSQEVKDYISTERLRFRVELESVTGKLAYTNITETIELSDEEVEVLNAFRIPV